MSDRHPDCTCHYWTFLCEYVTWETVKGVPNQRVTCCCEVRPHEPQEVTVWSDLDCAVHGLKSGTVYMFGSMVVVVE